MDKITLFLDDGYDLKYLPIKPPKHKPWWQDNSKTRNHINHCLPLAMANSAGFYILSPATFVVEWDGDTQADAVVKVIEKMPCCEVDNHAAFGSFTIQPGFVPKTRQTGDFILIKGIPNERCTPYQCMEAMIEAWWSPAKFGLVFLLNQAGRFLVNIGDPIAQMLVYKASGYEIEASTNKPEMHLKWEERRSRNGYTKDFDYLHGRYPDGSTEPSHLTSWD